MASAVNPCGFAMLPAYLGLLVGDAAGGRRLRTRERLGTGLLVAGTVTAGFVVLFALVGLLVGLGAQVLVGVFPWIGLGVGVALVGVAAYRLSGSAVYSAAPERLAARLEHSGEAGVRRYLLFGISYGIASLSCTLPIFLAVVGGTVTAASLVPSLLQLALYGLGTGTVISALTLAVALFSAAIRPPPRRGALRRPPRNASSLRGRQLHRVLLAHHRGPAGPPGLSGRPAGRPRRSGRPLRHLCRSPHRAGRRGEEDRNRLRRED